LREEPSLVLTEAGTPGAEAPLEDAAVARLVARISSEYVLRLLQLTIEAFGDVRAGLVGQAIETANTAHFDSRNDWGRDVVGADLTLPNEARRPVSMARLAESLGLPFETTRRIVQRLVDQGTCVRVEGGVIIPKSTAQRPDITAAVTANVGYARKFVRDLQAVGFAEAALFDGAELGAEAPQDSFAARVIARLSAQYLLRVCHLIAEVYGDIRYGVVAQTIIAANTAHLDWRGGDGWRYAHIEEPPPDEVRRPIRIARLSESLGLPFETVRRYVRRLVDDGSCVQVKGGLIVPRDVQQRPAAIRGAVANVGYVRKLVRDLHAVAAGFP
jgi:DNA-binding Lrp family transcriptional regulator